MKNWWLHSAIWLTVFAWLEPVAARAEPGLPTRDGAKEVRAVFAARCAGCHGPDLVKPKGRFGYVLDLRRVADNPEFVIPHRPSESELWVLVQRNEMPPPDSPHGPLSAAQKETIRDWIAAGAPDVTPESPADRPEPAGPETIEADSADRLLRWLGKFHLLLLHFPIALVGAAGVGELISVWQRNPLPSEATRFCLRLAALAVIPTAAMGWLFAAGGAGTGSPQLLAIHRWLGTAAAVWLVFTAVCAEHDARREVRSLRVRVLLIVGIVLTAITAHFGGLMAQGEDFFNY